jgi:hypothetical protein
MEIQSEHHVSTKRAVESHNSTDILILSLHIVLHQEGCCKCELNCREKGLGIFSIPLFHDNTIPEYMSKCTCHSSLEARNHGYIADIYNALKFCTLKSILSVTLIFMDAKSIGPKKRITLSPIISATDVNIRDNLYISASLEPLLKHYHSNAQSSSGNFYIRIRLHGERERATTENEPHQIHIRMENFISDTT